MAIKHIIQRPGRFGFTLVEMLVVICIIAILVSLVVGISANVYSYSWKAQTRQRQAIIMDAVDEYIRSMGGYVSPGLPTYYNQVSSVYDDSVAVWRCGQLYGALMSNDSSRAKLSELPRKAVADAVVYPGLYPDTKTVFLDGLDKPMDYDGSDGLAGTPVIISAGQDGEFGYGYTSQTSGLKPKETILDNIRSDQQ